MGEPEERIDQSTCNVVGEPLLVGCAGDDKERPVDGVRGTKGRVVHYAAAGST